MCLACRAGKRARAAGRGSSPASRVLHQARRADQQPGGVHRRTDAPGPATFNTTRLDFNNDHEWAPFVFAGFVRAQRLWHPWESLGVRLRRQQHSDHNSRGQHGNGVFTVAPGDGVWAVPWRRTNQHFRRGGHSPHMR